MLEEGDGAEAAALRVGYTSPSQLTREYSRIFGNAPLRDTRTSKRTSKRTATVVADLCDQRGSPTPSQRTARSLRQAPSDVPPRRWFSFNGGRIPAMLSTRRCTADLERAAKRQQIEPR